MKYISVPGKIFGTAMCAVLIWTLHMNTGVFGDAHDILKTSLEEIKATLNIAVESVDNKNTDPQYKKMLNFVGAWFMGEQIGEGAINNGIGGYTPDVVDQLHNLLPILKKTTDMEQEGENDDYVLKNQFNVIQNALHINEILIKIAELKAEDKKDLKMTSIAKLNDAIFKAVESDTEVLIPSLWSGPKPGGILLSLLLFLSVDVHGTTKKKFKLRVYDTNHKFDKNQMEADPNNEYPTLITPWKEIEFENHVRTTNFIIFGLTILRDNGQINNWLKGAISNSYIGYVLSFFIKSLNRNELNIGLNYFYDVYLTGIGRLEFPKNVEHDRKWPLRRYSVGPVGTIQAYFTATAKDIKKYPFWKLRVSHEILKNYFKRFQSDTDVHFDSRNRILIVEIVKRGADRLLRDAIEMAQADEWMPKQIGNKDDNFSKKLEELEKLDSALVEPKLKFISEIIKLRKSINEWIKTKEIDTYKLSKLSRSLGQREIPLKQIISFSIESTVDAPIDLTDYMSQGSLEADYRNCMVGSDVQIRSLNQFLVAFAPMAKVHWKYLRFTYDVKEPFCKPYFRRNAELLMRNLKLNGTDRKSLSLWTPNSFAQYKQFTSLINNILDTIITLPNSARTLEDYIIILRLQRTIWRVAQALDISFARSDPQRHLDLVQCTLSFPQCRKLLKESMTYNNYFLADSGAYGNILNTSSVNELKNLCKELIEEESLGKPILNHEKYMPVTPFIFDRLGFDRIDSGDREIYFKMAQNPQIYQTVRENHSKYNFGQDSLVQNAARSASLGEANAQFIYYQFFDALRSIFISDSAIGNQVWATSWVQIVYQPLRTPDYPIFSAFMVFVKKNKSTTNLIPVNQELMKGSEKSYIKASITEMVTTHILGLDVILNHLVRGSSVFWSSGPFIEEPTPLNSVENFFAGILEAFNDINEIYKMFMFGGTLKQHDRFEIKAVRRDAAGSVDFFLNCSAHLIRKIEVAPNYEELVMTLLMKTFFSIDNDLTKILGDLELADEETILEKSENENTTTEDESAKNEKYLKEGKTSPDQLLKSLINWATIAARFSTRIRSLKPEWNERYPDVPLRLYNVMFKYSRAKISNIKRIAPLDTVLLSHAEYFLFMLCAMNINDPNLRQNVYENLNPGKDVINLPQDASVMSSAMILHRFIALSNYRYNHYGPITEDFISNQFGASQIMDSIGYLAENNESFLILLAQYMKSYIGKEPETILKEYPQGQNLSKAILIYDQFGLNLIQCTLTENGKKARDPNAVLRYADFRRYFAASDDQIVPILGKHTEQCENRFEIKGFLNKDSHYSICENPLEKKISIYRHIPRFNKPCLLMKKKLLIESIQKLFSIYSKDGVDLYRCDRGNNAHFVWISRSENNPMYITHGRFWHVHNELVKAYYSEKSLRDKINIELSLENEEFSFDLNTKQVDNSPDYIERLFAPTILFPKIEIINIDPQPVFPLNAETKLMIVPEPIIRFSGGSRFGSYMTKNRLIFFFHQFRFRDRPDVSLTFVEDENGNLEMKGRTDLKVCEDQIFENNFWPALMMRKTDDPKADIRFAFVPMSNCKNYIQIETVNDLLKEKEISIKYDPEKENTLSINSDIVLMEAVSVEKYIIKETKSSVTEKITPIYGYKLKPTSRLQRILLAYHNLNLRNYENCLQLLDPRTEIDHNTEFSADEKKLLLWMANMKSAQEPEALALRLMAYIHLYINSEQFPTVDKSKKTKDNSTNYSSSSKASYGIPENDDDIINPYGHLVSSSSTSNANSNTNNPKRTIIQYLISISQNPNDCPKLGAYFTVSPLLPRRFQIDQVFSDAMASQKIQNLLYDAYENELKYYGYKEEKMNKLDYVTPCDYKNYVDALSNNLEKAILVPLNESEQKELNLAISNRFIIPYTGINCNLARLIAHKLLHIHAKKEAVPKDLQELAYFHLYLGGNPIGIIEVYIAAFAHPSVSNNEIKEIQSLINFSKFIDELTPKIIDGVPSVSNYKTELTKLSVKVFEIGKRSVTMSSLFNLFDNNQLFQTISSTKTEKHLIVDPILPITYNAKEAAERKINSIKFTKDDFHYIRFSDREIYAKVINDIDKARSKKEIEMTENSDIKLIKLFSESKTQNALQIAIKDYMNQRKEPIKFDQLIDTLFDSLMEHMNGRLKELKANLVKLERRYHSFLQSVKVNKKFDSSAVISSLRRIFNENKRPSLKDLRDCFMQMNLKCLQDRFPEKSNKTVFKISHIVNSYYIQMVIFNNFNAIIKKIKEFNELSEKAAKAENELKNTTDKNVINELDLYIFDQKDTALLQVEDIYNDMEKLMLLELRLQDPVTLNFEFMSSRFHLTNVQVKDIANLATRNWEDEFRKVLKERMKKEALKQKASKQEALDEDGKQEALDEDGAEGGDKSEPFVDEAINKLKKFEKRFKNTIDIDPIDMWVYLPRDERKLSKKERQLINDINNSRADKTNRQALDEIIGVGVLQHYNTEQDSYFSRVIQRKMAAGKTTVLGTAAAVKKADGKTLSVLVILSALYQSSAPDMQKRTSDFFNTRGFAFSMPKPRLTIPGPNEKDHPAKAFLSWTLKTLVMTINSNSYLIVTPETLQSFLNSYVEFLDTFVNSTDGRFNPELSACLNLFATIYDIFRSRGSIILDEIDSLMRPQKELNFPTNKRESIVLAGVELTSDLLLFSAIDEDVKDAGLYLLANQQAALNNDQYLEVRKKWRDYIKSRLEDKKSRWHEIFFPKTDKSHLYDVEKLISFFFDPSPLDKTDAPSKFDIENDVKLQEELNWMSKVRKESGQNIFHVMMIVKMQVKNWLKNCFKGSVNEHYGPSFNINTGPKKLLYAIPYTAANTPAEGSIFSDRWETVNKTFMMYLVKNLTIEEVSMILLELKTISQGQDSTMDVKSEFAKACPGYDLLNIKFNAQNKIIDKGGKLFACMKSRSESSLRLIFYWVVKIIFENEQFFAEQITSNAINLTTMFPSVQGYSGTIDNVNILPHQVMVEAETDHRLNEQANGAITMKLLQQNDCVTTVQKIETIIDIDILLKNMCRDFEDLSGFSAFVDVGALLKDFTNATVALALAKIFNRKTVLYYNERTNQLSFLEYDEKSKSFTDAVLEGSETNYLNSATNSLVKDRFTYYDQRHITGSDILQPPTAKAFLTIGPKVLLRDILQGVMRMRQFQSGQSIHFITTSAVETLLSKFCEGVKEENNLGKPRVSQKHLIALGAMNEDEKQLAENVRLYRVKIDAELRAFVMDRMTEALAQVDPFQERVKLAKVTTNYVPRQLHFGFNHEFLFKQTRSLFIRDVHENAVNWATINIQMDTKVAVQNYKEKRIKMIPDFWKTKKNDAGEIDWNKVSDNLDVLVAEIPEEKEKQKDVEYARSVLNYLNPIIETTIIPDQFKDTTGEVDEQGITGSTVEMELQLELQQELQLELEQAIAVNDDATVLPEPELVIKPKIKEAPRNMMNLGFSTVVNKEFEFLDKTSKLLTPWKLYSDYKDSGVCGSALRTIYEIDLLCPGMSSSEEYPENHCKRIEGFVGISYGIGKVTSSEKLDFVTMASREATHLLFWRGRSDSTKTGYKYAVFLISGSEAISLHQNWNFKSSIFSEFDNFWLTDLLGYEINGPPMASTAFGSKYFSLLEHDYAEHFATLHFRALVLNGSFNILMASEQMYKLLRQWLGDESRQDESIPKISTEMIQRRAKFFINRLTWMSKLREEIVPEDPIIRDILRLTAKLTVDFDQSLPKYESHLTRGFMTTYSDNQSKQLIDLDSISENRWIESKNINKTTQSFYTIPLIVLGCLLLIVSGVIVYRWRVGIDWREECNFFLNEKFKKLNDQIVPNSTEIKVEESPTAEVEQQTLERLHAQIDEASVSEGSN